MKSVAAATLVNSLSLGRLKYGWYSMPWVSEEQPVFCGGCSRSGTTLLYSLLNSHSRLALGLETGLLTGVRNLDGLASRTSLPKTDLVRILRASRCYPEFTQNVLKALALRDGKPRWGDKTPRNVLAIDSIFRYFPRAKFIHAIRDGRDVVCSLRGYPPSFGNRFERNPWPLCVERWKTWTRIGREWLGDPRYFELRYEDLTREPEATLRALFEWLEEPWEASIMEKSRTTRVFTHPELGKPINQSRTGRWTAELPREAGLLLLEEAGDLLVELGYAEDGDWIDALAS